MHRIILVGCLLMTVVATAQKKKEPKELFFLYDSKWKTVSQAEDAAYLACVKVINDTTYEWNNYHIAGPLLSVETYRDKEATIPNGYWAFFDANGKIDSSGYCAFGKRIGSWYDYSDTLSVIRQRKYEQGKLIEAYNERALRERGKKDTAEIKQDEVKEAKFKGGVKGWANYLTKNINYPKRATSLGIKGMIKIRFIIMTDGAVDDVHIIQSIEYSADTEALRLITNSPPWEPAVLNGKNVKAYRMQPITFAGN